MPTLCVAPGAPRAEEVESQDEVKVFKYEGDEEEESEKLSPENHLTEDKSSLITETEEDKSTHVPSPSSSFAKHDGRLPDPFGLFGASAWGAERLSYLSHFAYPYTNGTSAMDKVGLGGRPGSPLFSLYHNSQPYLGQPPPAHMGISPYQLDSKAGIRPPVYPFTASGQYPYSLGADFTAAQMAAASWFSPSGLMRPHPGLTPPLTHPLSASPKTELQSTSYDHHSVFPYQLTPVGSPRHPSMDQKPVLGQSHKSMIETKNGEKKPHIKKPLNAFMLYMKEMRAKVGAECMLKESAAINQILGRKWHALTREEQAKYYEMSRKERQLHMQMYPGWSSRQNYSNGKKKNRNRDKTKDEANMKKCRARYGLELQNQWCKPCRRKKKCIRYMEGEDGDDTAPGSAESHEMTADSSDDDDVDELQDMNLSSPFSYLGHRDHPMLSPASSSLMSSPGPSLASPSGPPSLLMPSPASLASPLTPEDVRDQQLHQVPQQPPHRPPVGTNPRDINNPLSVNQLTGQCATKPTKVPSTQEPSHPTMVRVT